MTKQSFNFNDLNSFQRKISTKHIFYGGLFIFSLILSWPSLWIGLTISAGIIGLSELVKIILPHFSSLFTTIKSFFNEKYSKYNDLHKKSDGLKKQYNNVEQTQSKTSNLNNQILKSIMEIKASNIKIDELLSKSKLDLEAANISNATVNTKISEIKTTQNTTSSILNGLEISTNMLASRLYNTDNNARHNKSKIIDKIEESINQAALALREILCNKNGLSFKEMHDANNNMKIKL